MGTNEKSVIDRLVACGYTESHAANICKKYTAENKYIELEQLIHFVELMNDDRREYV